MRRVVAKRVPLPRLSLKGSLAALALVVTVTQSASSQSQQAFKLDGIVRTESNQPIDAVTLRIPELSFNRVLDLSAEGAIRVSLGANAKTHLHCQLSAPGFETRNLTFVVKPIGSSLGIAHLKSLVEIGPIQITPNAKGNMFVDFWLTMKTNRPLFFDSVAIAAEDSTNKRVPCPSFDSEPQATIRFSGTAFVTQRRESSGGAAEFVLHLNVLEETVGDASVKVMDGVVFSNPCGEKQLKLVAPYSFTLTAKDNDTPVKLRIEVPISLAIAGEEPLYPEWRHAIVSLLLRNEGIISVTAN